MQAKSELSILLLEDQGLIRDGMRALIQIAEPSSHILEASSFEKAVELIHRRQFDIAFLDIKLKSDRTGLDVLHYIRNSELDTRAIMLSADPDKETVMACISAGASGYILKDMENDGVFRRALDTVFQGGVFLPASVLGRGGYSPRATAEPIALTPQQLGISGRKLEVLYYLCQGLPNKSIANKMGIEPGTVGKDYVPKLLQIFKVTRRTELMVEIARRGIVVPSPSESLAAT